MSKTRLTAIDAVQLLRSMPAHEYLVFDTLEEAERDVPGITQAVSLGQIEAFSINTFEENGIGFRVVEPSGPNFLSRLKDWILSRGKGL